MQGGREYKNGLWTEEEDKILMNYVSMYGAGRWSRTSRMTGLKRCGKSCRLRWINYLNPTVKKDGFSVEEEDLIIRLHNLLGNRWSLIAGRVPGRTDNQVKNHWNTHLRKKLGISKSKNKGSGEFDNPKRPSSHNNGELIQNPVSAQEPGMEDYLLSSFWASCDNVVLNNGMYY